MGPTTHQYSPTMYLLSEVGAAYLDVECLVDRIVLNRDKEGAKWIGIHLLNLFSLTICILLFDINYDRLKSNI
jgi:hypothetical protein